MSEFVIRDDVLIVAELSPMVDPLNAAPGRIPLTELTLMDCVEIVSAWTVVAEMKFVDPMNAAPGTMPLILDTFIAIVERV